MEFFNLLPEEDEINEEITASLKSSATYQNYITWMKNSGCIFPSVDYPVAFGRFGYAGFCACTDLPPLKAFMFIPMSIVITPQLAEESEVRAIFEQNRSLFNSSMRGADFKLWTFLIYEKLKDTSSFYYPYFEIIRSPQMIIDWSDSDLDMLQDEWILYENAQIKLQIEQNFDTLRPFLEANPDLFPSNDLYSEFLWAYKVVNSRAFNFGEGMILPLADGLNHSDVNVDINVLSTYFLSYKARSAKVIIADYTDFVGESIVSKEELGGRTYLNSLEKYFQKNGDSLFMEKENVWEIQDLFEEVFSSSDEEEHVNHCGWISDQERDDEIVETENKYIVFRTGAKGSFRKERQVFNCYGRLNNFDLLIEYSFALLPNRYDSYALKLYNTQANTELQVLSPSESEVEKQLFYLKYNKVNMKLVKFLKGTTNEIVIVDEYLRLCRLAFSRFPTSLSDDEAEISAVNSPNQLFALSNLYTGYRVSQKRILNSQIEMMVRLKEVLGKVSQGTSLSQAHWERKDIENAREMYPLSKFLKKLLNAVHIFPVIYNLNMQNRGSSKRLFNPGSDSVMETLKKRKLERKVENLIPSSVAIDPPIVEVFPWQTPPLLKSDVQVRARHAEEERQQRINKATYNTNAFREIIFEK